MTTFHLKVIACASMLIDHVGMIFFADVLLLRIIGRLAFPIFAYLIASGAVHTSDKARYLGRLLLLAVISEAPFQLATFGRVSGPPTRNVFFTLFLGLAGICAFAWLKAWRRRTGAMLGLLAMVACGVAASKAGSDYGYVGVLLISLMYLCLGRRLLSAVALVACNSIALATALVDIYRAGQWWVLSYFDSHDWLSIGRQTFGSLAIGPLMLRNGRPGPRLKWAFYFFYPVHLAVLWLASTWI